MCSLRLHALGTQGLRGARGRHCNLSAAPQSCLDRKPSIRARLHNRTASFLNNCLFFRRSFRLSVGNLHPGLLPRVSIDILQHSAQRLRAFASQTCLLPFQGVDFPAIMVTPSVIALLIVELLALYYRFLRHRRAISARGRTSLRRFWGMFLVKQLLQL